MKHKNSATQCIEHAKDLMKEDIGAIRKDFMVMDWLQQMNLGHLADKFKKHKFTRMEDMVLLDEAKKFKESDIGNELETRRMWNMLQGEEEHKDLFGYLSKHGVRSIVQLFFKEKSMIDEFVDQIPEETLTGFQLRDIFDNNSKLTAIKSAIYEKIMENKIYKRGAQMDKTHPSEEDSEEKEEKINFDIEAFFKELDAPEGINLLQKQDMCNARVFMKVPYETLEKTLEIKPSGKKVKVMKKVKE